MGESWMNGYGNGTSFNSVAKLSLPVRALGRVITGRTAAGQDAAAIFFTDGMTCLLSCSDMMYDHDMPFLSIALFRT